MNDTFFSIAEARSDPAMREIGRKMIRGESGFVLYQAIAGFESYMYYAPIRRSGWTLAVAVPEGRTPRRDRATCWSRRRSSGSLAWGCSRSP